MKNPKNIFRDLKKTTDSLKKESYPSPRVFEFWYHQCKELFSLYLNGIIPWVQYTDGELSKILKDNGEIKAVIEAGGEFVSMALNYFNETKDYEIPKFENPKVFIVHGRNHDLRDKIDIFINKELKIETIIMEAGPNSGRTLPEKFETMASESNIALFIYSADDYLENINDNKKIKRPRQNVVLETGYFWGALGRKGKVIFLVDDDPLLELPSDLLGIGWIKITDDLGETKLRLQKEIMSFLNNN